MDIPTEVEEVDHSLGREECRGCMSGTHVDEDEGDVKREGGVDYEGGGDNHARVELEMEKVGEVTVRREKKGVRFPEEIKALNKHGGARGIKIVLTGILGWDCVEVEAEAEGMTEPALLFLRPPPAVPLLDFELNIGFRF